MTAPRTGLFQRKGAPSSTSAASSSNTPDAKVSPPDGDETTPGKEGDGSNEVTCPQCGCQFDPSDDTQQAGKPMPDMGGSESDLGAQIAAMVGAGASGGAGNAGQ